MEAKILLVADPNDPAWIEKFSRRLPQEIRLEMTSADDALSLAGDKTYRLWLVDTNAVENVVGAIQAIKSDNPEARIIVLTNAPTWEGALQVMRAGAIDYQSKLLNMDRLLEAVNRILPPCFPRYHPLEVG